MSTPTRYAAQQWEMGGLTPSARQLALQIQSLRARVEALEADQLAHRVQSGTLTSAERAELGVVTRVQLEAAMLRSASDARQAAMDELRAASAEARPTVKESLTDGGSLLEMVANAIYNVPHDSAAEARAAIREVAAALLEWHDSDQLVHTAWEAAKWLQREADR
jgi:hypothetical protein